MYADKSSNNNSKTNADADELDEALGIMDNNEDNYNNDSNISKVSEKENEVLNVGFLATHGHCLHFCACS